MAGARRLLLLRDALLLGIGCAGVGMPGAGAPALRIGRPRSPGSGGPSCGAVLRQARIVARQIGEAIRRRCDCWCCRVRSRRSGAAAAARRTARRRCRCAATAPRPSSTLRESRVTGGRLGPQPHLLRRPVAVGRPAASSCGASVTTAASRRCGRCAPSAGDRRRAGARPRRTADRRSCGCPGRDSSRARRRLRAPITQSGGISPWPMPAGNSMNTCRPSSKARSGRQAGLSPSMR